MIFFPILKPFQKPIVSPAKCKAQYNKLSPSKSPFNRCLGCILPRDDQVGYTAGAMQRDLINYCRLPKTELHQLRQPTTLKVSAGTRRKLETISNLMGVLLLLFWTI